jgi:cytochrome c oxidase subunit 1
MQSKFPLPRLFIIGALIMMVVAFISDWRHPHSTLDIHQHDTYYVIAYFHINTAIALCFLIFALCYYAIPKLSKRRIHYGWGVFHFVVTLVGILVILIPRKYVGIAGRPRRYVDFAAQSQLREYFSLDPLVSVIVLLVFIAQLIFTLNLCYSIVAGKRR